MYIKMLMDVVFCLAGVVSVLGLFVAIKFSVILIVFLYDLFD